jgi:sodium transport system ATP-binding protein
MIEAEGLTKIFRTKKKRRRVEILAADGVTFQCLPGEIFGLLGANGAGKTTTLRMLSTILRPTAGSARVAGFDIVQEPEKVRRHVGFLSTQTALYGRLTAWEFVEYFGRLYGVPEERLACRLEELSDLLEMKEFEGQRCDKLSTGQKQKVSIARTLVHDPPVMVFDEPTVGLDVMTQRTIVGFIRSCREQKKTVILSTHVMAEAEKLCDRLAIIHDGRIVATGALEELRAHHGIDDLEDLFLHLVDASREGRR